jgi:hypothetical protein
MTLSNLDIGVDYLFGQPDTVLLAAHPKRTGIAIGEEKTAMVAAKFKDAVVEIRDLDDLVRVVKEVHAENEPLVIDIGGGQEVIVKPAPRPGDRRRVTQEEKARSDDEAFLSSAGSLAGLFDSDEFRRQYRAERGSRRPPVVLDFSEE